MTDRTLAAHHESAHSVVAATFGFDISSVVLWRPGQGDGEQLGICKTSSWQDDMTDDPRRMLIYFLAGSAAEWRLTGRTSALDSHDRQTAAMIAAEFGCGDYTGDRDQRVRRLLEHAEIEARALVYAPTIWAAVRDVAAALMQRQVLTGRDVQVALRDARR